MSAAAAPIKTVGVCGAGVMGRGIAIAVARGGFTVVLRDLSQAVVEDALRAIDARMRRAGDPDPAREKVMGRIRPTVHFHDLADCDLLIEAVIEDLDEKRNLFTVLDTTIKETCIFASNTSSLSITDLAAQTSRADRVAGLHFFNPADRMPLVEIVSGLETSEACRSALREFALALKKTPIDAPDTPGFIVNRMLVPYLLHAVRLVEARIASADDVDTAMRLGCGHPMGPLRLLDEIGLDTAIRVAESLHASLGDPACVVPPLLRRLTSAGRFGRKSGRGFFDYAGAESAGEKADDDRRENGP